LEDRKVIYFNSNNKENIAEHHIKWTDYDDNSKVFMILGEYDKLIEKIMSELKSYKVLYEMY
jgi:hypothetical protein